MNTQCLPITDESIALGAELLRQGQLVAFPTETVYGLGADALNAEAVAAIFAAKGRPQDNPLIVHVARPQDTEALCYMNDTGRMLMDAFWPGPLTLLLPKKPIIPDLVTASLPSVALRLPSHPAARRLLSACGRPVAAPSANRSGKPSPTRAEHVLTDMDGRVPLILDGGASEVGLESTVLNLTSEVPCILRPGGVTREMLLKYLPRVDVAGSVLRPLEKGEKALSPGMRYKHYAPAGQLTLVTGSDEHAAHALRRLYHQAVAEGRTACVLAFTQMLPRLADCECRDLGSVTHPEEIANRLFDLLRLMDKEKIDMIFSQVVDIHGIGLAIMNRMGRAAAFRIVDADQEDA